MRTEVVTAVLLLSTLAACTPEPHEIRIGEPTYNGVVTLAPQRIVVDFVDTSDLATFDVNLNGLDLSDRFAFAPRAGGRTVAVAEGVWELGLFQPENALFFSIDTGTEQGVLTLIRPFFTDGDPYPDEIVDFTPGTGAGFGGEAPEVVLGPPRGGGIFQGSLDVLSLGLGGAIELAFVDNAVVDLPGPDLTIFENAFLPIGADLLTGPPFSEPGRVSVSQDGVTWFEFSCALSPGEAPYHPGCAGVTPTFASADLPEGPHPALPTAVPVEDLVGLDAFGLVPPTGAGGDSFDLADLGLTWARYVRIEAAGFAAQVVGPDDAGFDLDAVAAVHAAPWTDLDENGIPDAAEW